MNGGGNICAVSCCYENRTSDEKNEYHSEGVGSRMMMIFSNETEKDYSIERAMTEYGIDYAQSVEENTEVRNNYEKKDFFSIRYQKTLDIGIGFDEYELSALQKRLKE
ncbi:22511_t:CDS:2 [Gigaspora margarita]|uniref:22511_t:CDS:1 n=1 Tax=Gigaspora margarita TaxID=4874 RepID=A0ABN7V7J0_GIGMA|nr:22511_t:CDS:2 [Gigaspora margarita]